MTGWRWAVARLVLAGFCWLTAAYAFVVSSAFAYLQFVRPRVFRWVGQFSDWHAAASLAWLTLLLVVLWPVAIGRTRGSSERTAETPSPLRPLAILLLVLCTAACLWNFFNPVLPSLAPGSWSITTGVLALVPIVWLAAIDHVRLAGYIRRQTPAGEESELRAFEGRLLVAVAIAAFAVTIVFGIVTSIGLIGRFEPDLLVEGLALGFGVSLAAHLCIFAGSFLVAALIVRATSASFYFQFLALTGALVVLIATVFARLVGESLSLSGASGLLAGSFTALSVIGTWTGLRTSSLASADAKLASAVDLYFGNAAPGRKRPTSALQLIGAGLLAYSFVLVSARADWDFVLLDSGVLAVWLCSFGIVYRATPPMPQVRGWSIAATCLVPLVVMWAATATATAEHRRLERYSVYNPSFRLADRVLRSTASASPTFDAYLRAHSGLTDVEVAPISVDFVPPPIPKSDRLAPIFLFVIDSLRPDYLAPYNASVRFTPHIAEFAADAVVFANSFTAFGGTGLSLPAIWAGAALPHKQYVQPFAPMNALEKLLHANGYRLMVGLDSIMSQLLVPSPGIDELDRGRNVMDYEFCRTLGELESKLQRPADSAPIFAYSLPQDIHMSRLPAIVVSGEGTETFYAPYATKVRALDTCFGQFIGALKKLDLYRKSLIILTSDHGEMLGEDGRFGHSYHLFPQIVQVPLIVHLPESGELRPLDPHAVSLTTDIVPTIYEALGYRPIRTSPLMGRSLVERGSDRGPKRAALQPDGERRRDTYVIAASYGAVYASLRHNGRRLYIVDAIRGGDQAFEKDASGRWMPVPVSDGLRMVNQLAIRRYVDQVAREYRLRVW